MSKRVRGTVRAHRRPGTRPPSERSAAQRRAAEPRPARVETAEFVADEPAEDQSDEALAEAAPAPSRAPRPGQRIHHKIKAGSLLAARATTEYVYVSQDMRRIVLVAGALIGILFVLWLLIVVMKVIPLPFY